MDPAISWISSFLPKREFRDQSRPSGCHLIMLGRPSLLAYITGTSTLIRQYLCHYSSLKDYVNLARWKAELLLLIHDHRELNSLEKIRQSRISFLDLWERSGPRYVLSSPFSPLRSPQKRQKRVSSKGL